MRAQTMKTTPIIIEERTFLRFTLLQRLEHAVVFLSITILVLTGLPQKYRTTTWSEDIISTPDDYT